MKDVRKDINIRTNLVAKIVKNHPNDMGKTSGQDERRTSYNNCQR